MTAQVVAASYLPEVQERAVRLVLEGGGDHPTQWSAISLVSAKIGCTAETPRKWVRKPDHDAARHDCCCEAWGNSFEPQRTSLHQGVPSSVLCPRHLVAP